MSEIVFFTWECLALGCQWWNVGQLMALMLTMWKHLRDGWYPVLSFVCRCVAYPCWSTLLSPAWWWRPDGQPGTDRSITAAAIFDFWQPPFTHCRQKSTPTTQWYIINLVPYVTDNMYKHTTFFVDIWGKMLKKKQINCKPSPDDIQHGGVVVFAQR